MEEVLEELTCCFCHGVNSVYNPVCKRCGKDLPLLPRDSNACVAWAATYQSDWVLTGQQTALPVNWGNFRIEACVAKSPSAEVYAAKDRRSHQTVALKLLTDSKACTNRQWLKEVRALRCLNHPHIAAILDAFVWQNYPCLVFEWIDGAPYQPSPNPNNSSVRKQLLAVCDALETAHTKGVIHCDLKPAHILQANHGAVKLIDFGMAKRMPFILDSLPSTPLSQKWRGTPAYMSPEQIEGKTLDHRSDIFSLALIFGEWFGGQHPFAHVNIGMMLHKICYAAPVWQAEHSHCLSSQQQYVLENALAKKPEQRVSSVKEFADRFWGEGRF